MIWLLHKFSQFLPFLGFPHFLFVREGKHSFFTLYIKSQGRFCLDFEDERNYSPKNGPQLVPSDSFDTFSEAVGSSGMFWPEINKIWSVGNFHVSFHAKTTQSSLTYQILVLIQSLSNLRGLHIKVLSSTRCPSSFFWKF